ncbi:MAG TPA: sigma-70 family RNA polymerase sigma factor [Candidatus Elarobacter sp.]|jgi:RNA polymerase sigma-70 factor (ECF subfamily)|nr:sigma-70 family RNA polymerase sigma factor [Candidatus Elarobacter sp.]
MSRWAPDDLIAGALDGDEPATERLIATVWPPCFRLAATVIGDRALAQDAAQEACVIVHRSVRGLRSAAAFDAWLYRIVLREAARVRRRHPAAQEPAAEAVDTSDAGDTAALDVWRALARLSPELRDVTVLFYFDDLTTEQIAAILRVRHVTVRTRLVRARERLRGLLDDYAGAPAAARREVQHHGV